MSKKVVKITILIIIGICFMYIPKVSADSCEDTFNSCLERAKGDKQEEICYKKMLSCREKKESSTPNSGEEYISEDEFTCVEGNNIYRAVGVVADILFWLRILIPVIIVVTATTSLLKAVISQDDNQIKEMTTILTKRIAVGAAIFFIPAIIIAALKYAVSAYNNSNNNFANSWSACIERLR